MEAKVFRSGNSHAGGQETKLISYSTEAKFVRIGPVTASAAVGPERIC